MAWHVAVLHVLSPGLVMKVLLPGVQRPLLSVQRGLSKQQSLALQVAVLHTFFSGSAMKVLSLCLCELLSEGVDLGFETGDLGVEPQHLLLFNIDLGRALSMPAL